VNIPESQSKALNDLASSGDATAKEWASSLGIEPKPATSGDENKGQNGAAEGAKSEGEAKPEGGEAKTAPTQGQAKPEGETSDGVDAHRDGASDQGKRPSIYAENRRLKQERRKLREERDESRRREEAITNRIAQLEARLKGSPDGSKTPETEEDLLTRLLSRPEDVFRERDKTLVQAVREALKEDLAKARALEESRSQKSSAIKTLESIKDFDLERDEEEVFEIMEKEYGLDEDDVAHLLSTRPTKTANLIRRAWEKTHSLALPDSVKADKASAKASAAIGGSTHSKTTLRDLNSRATGAKSKEDLDRLWEEAGKLS
jgi:hypothetical protein